VVYSLSDVRSASSCHKPGLYRRVFAFDKKLYSTFFIIPTSFMCQSDLAPCKDRVLIRDTLYNNYKLLKNALMSKQYKQ